MCKRLLTNVLALSGLAMVVIALLMIGTFIAPQLSAQASLATIPLPPCPAGVAGDASCLPGTTTNTTNGPNSGIQNGVSVAVDCAGTIYYTNTWVGGLGGTAPSNTLFKIDKTGASKGSIPIVDSVSGGPLFIDEMTWDPTRNVLWGQLHSTTSGTLAKVYQINPTTGVATFEFTATNSTNVGEFFDGITYDGSNDTLLISTDVSDTIETYCAGGAACGGVVGAFIKQITPKDSLGNTLGSISGLIVGVGDLLYLGQDGLSQIVQVKKSDGTFIGAFTSPGGERDEGLECDPVNFAPTLALWSRDFGINQNANPNTFFEPFLEAFSLPAGTCTCGNAPTGCPATQGFWHKTCLWPAVTITVDGITYNGSTNFSMIIGGYTYTQAELDALLPNGNLHTGGYVNGFSQLIAAILNIAAGGQHSASVDATISALNTALMGQNPIVTSATKLNSLFTLAGQAALNAAEGALDTYNSAVGLNGSNGLACTTEEAFGLTVGSCKNK